MLPLTLLFTAIVPLARGASVLFEQEGMMASVYYDLHNQYCGAAVGLGPSWAEVQNTGTPFCSGQQDVSLIDLGVDNIVAMNWDWVRADPDKWCGKEVQITDPQGNLFQPSSGPLFIWDACQKCAEEPRVDLSGSVMSELQGGNCEAGLVPGLQVRVLDNNIWKKLPLGGRDESYTGEAGTPEGHGPPVVGPTAAGSNATSGASPASTSMSAAGTMPSASQLAGPAMLPAASPASAPPSVAAPPQGACTYGAEQCVGGKSQKCNYIDGVTHETGWVDLGPCNPQAKRRSDRV